MNYEEHLKIFSKLFNLEKIWFKTLTGFLPDSRLTNPQRMIDGSGDSLIADDVIYEVAYYNCY